MSPTEDGWAASSALGEHPEDIGVRAHHGVAEDLPERPRAAFPVQEGAGFLGHNGNGKDDIGQFGDGRVVVLQRDHEVEFAQCFHRIERVVRRLDPADERCADATGGNCVVQLHTGQARLREVGRGDPPRLRNLGCEQRHR